MAKKKKPKKRLWPPGFVRRRGLVLPLTPFEQRMADLSIYVPLPSWHPDSAALVRRARAAMETDLAFRQKCQDNIARIPHWQFMKNVCGSGHFMASTLRGYFNEYISRIINYGIHSLPASFNIIEAFLQFDTNLCLFDMRAEREYLLAIDDYFDWYASNDMPKDPALLMTVMDEGINYSFNMAGDASGYRLATVDSQLVIVGVSLVRHKHELSCMMMAGENPPHPSDADIAETLSSPSQASRGKDSVAADPDLGIKDRYLEHLPGFARVVFLTRFDLRTKRYDVRNVNLDCGPSYSVLTDDIETLDHSFPGEQHTLTDSMKEGLQRYDGLFSALASLIFLPVAFVAEAAHVQDQEFKTEYFARQGEARVAKAVAALGGQYAVQSRIVRCLAVASVRGPSVERSIRPPEMAFQSDGFWKTLGPNQVGQDKDGNPIVGRTWVCRTDSWSNRTTQSILLTRPAPAITGPDPGIIYIQRSDSHELEIYKIGLTRRTAEERSKELSYSTSAPLPFGILAQWTVGDCSLVEREVHVRLTAYRVNPRREFFRLPLKDIVAAINEEVVASQAPAITPLPEPSVAPSPAG